MNIRILLACLSLTLLGSAVFAPTIRFDFVNWDDPAYIHFNDSIKGWTPANLYGVATETVTRNYAPLTILSFLIDYSFTGMDPAGYHFTNVLLHIINGLLVLILIQQLTGSLFIGWVTAALFLIHPVQIETVAWISSRKGLLSGTFMLAALVVRLRPNAELKHDGWYIGLLLAALLAKALAVVLPPIVLLYDILVRREKPADAFVRQIIPGLMALLLLLYTMGAQTSILGGVRSHMSLSLPTIMAVDVTILWTYLGMLAWPTNLCVLYDPPTSGIALPVTIGTCGWCLVAWFAWTRRQQQPLFLFALASFLLLLFPVLNFFRITTLMNDRYLYLPCLCVFAPAAGFLQLMAERIAHFAGSAANQISLIIRSLAATGAIGASVVLTSQHLPVWKNAETLWSHAHQHVPQLPVVQIQRALTLHDSGRIREAVEILKLAQKDCVADEADRQRIERHIAEWTMELSRVAAVGRSF